MYNLEHFSLGELFSVSTAIRSMGEQAHSMEEVARRIVRYFYSNFISQQTGERAFALVRFYKTHPYDDLPPALQNFAAHTLDMLPETNKTQTQCLTLLATV